MRQRNGRGTFADSRDKRIFGRARLQLTCWYALTLSAVMVLFSGLVYAAFAARLGGYDHEQESAAERRVERETASFALGELRIYLVLGNAALLALAAGGAYWLAGRTLTPIAEAMARQDRFTADASHELRTPLTAIRTAVDVALLRARSPAAYQAVLQAVKAETEGMTELIEQLLWLGRGARTWDVELTDIRAVLADVAAQTATLAHERGSRLSVEPGPATSIMADPVGLRLVLLNLVRNALQHTPSGTSVIICTERAENGTVLRVCDDGPGIPERERANVFQPFYRLRTTGSDGYGLGLALTQEFVSAAGGTIHIGEAPRGGATVSVWLPQVACETAAVPRAGG